MNLTTIHLFNNITNIYCRWCPLLTSIPLLKEINYLNCYGCRWLNHIQNEEYNNNIIKLKIIQKYYKNRKARNFIKYIKTKEFNEWFYHPEGIGGKMCKRNMLTFLHKI